MKFLKIIAFGTLACWAVGLAALIAKFFIDYI
jgi:hypothetical protein